MSNSMMFPETFDEFVEIFGFVDSKEYYTNGSELIQVFRVKQWLEHESNRLQADKEAIIAGQETLQKALAEKSAEIERLKEEHKKVRAYTQGNGWGFVSFLEFGKNQRAEAIKEFAERVKEKFSGVSLCNNGFVNSTIDNLVKEMVGDAE